MSCMFSLFRKRRKSPPPASTISKSRHAPTEADDEELARKLGLLTVRDDVEGSAHNTGRFVGGFNPALNANGRNVSPAQQYGESVSSARPIYNHASNAPSHPGHPPLPPNVSNGFSQDYTGAPVMSRTMQYALSSPDARGNPHAAQGLRPPAPNISVRTTSQPLRAIVSTPPPQNAYAPSTPQWDRPGPLPRAPASVPKLSTGATPSFLQVPQVARARSASSPPSPTVSAATASSGQGDTLTCSAITKAGTRCKHLVKQRSALESLDPAMSVELERYCHQHVKERLKPSQFPRKDGIWITYSDWIPSYLRSHTQVNLRREIEKPLSAADEPGYIYVFEIRVKGDDEHVYYKVGRTKKLNKRIDEWSKQCGTNELYLRWWHPGPANERDRKIVRGCVEPGEPGLWCHRLERLVHLELADLALNAPYLDPQFPNTLANTADVKTSKKTPCPDCGALHREIFKFPRAKDGVHKGREWETLVKPVIEKWARFVKDLRQET